MTAHRLLKALADPTRLRIAMLLKSGELCVCDVTETLGLPQSTVSRHMAVLRSAHVVIDRRSRRWVHYQLADTPLSSGIIFALDQQLSSVEPFSSDRRKLLQHLAQKRFEEMGCETP